MTACVDRAAPDRPRRRLSGYSSVENARTDSARNTAANTATMTTSPQIGSSVSPISTPAPKRASAAAGRSWAP
ncbi:MAG: hypothetical protein U5R31_13465 [Acidimicrobiia bacterium]|nr:hypothetical protein [Acidimicrobiia bacterium]